MGKNSKQDVESGASSNRKKGKGSLGFIIAFDVSMTRMQTFFILFSLFLSTHSSTYFTEPLLPQQKNVLQLLPQSFLKSCTNRFSPFNEKTVSSSGETVMLATTCDKEFCVFDAKFETAIAYGKSWFDASAYKDENHYIESILEAQNVKGCKKCFVFLRYIVTIPFIKYLQYASIIIQRYLVPMVQACFHKIDECLEIPGWDDGGGTGCEVCVLVFCFCPLSIAASALLLYFDKVIAFHIKTLPFHALTLPIELLYLEKQYISLFTHCAFRLAFFFPYSLFFPKHVDMFLVPSYPFEFFRDHVKAIIFKIPAFEIQPTLKMFPLPFLIERKRTCKFYAWIFFFEIFYSLLLIIGFQKWIPQQGEGDYF